MKDITYEANSEGFRDAIHGKFVVHLLRDHTETEVVIVFFKCPKGETGICGTKFNEVVEDLGCKRFQTDKSGP